MTTLSPFDRAYIESYNVIIPCSGPVQAMGCLKPVLAVPKMLTLVRNIAAGYATADDVSAARVLMRDVEGK